jgi:hypothetical protein
MHRQSIFRTTFARTCTLYYTARRQGFRKGIAENMLSTHILYSHLSGNSRGKCSTYPKNGVLVHPCPLVTSPYAGNPRTSLPHWPTGIAYRYVFQRNKMIFLNNRSQPINVSRWMLVKGLWCRGDLSSAAAIIVGH